MSQAPTAQVEAVLDLTGWGVPLHGPEELGALWNALEPGLHGRTLAGVPVHTFEAAQGVVRLEIVRLDPAVDVVTPRTTVNLVAVREAPTPADRCVVCEREGRPAERGALRCADCAADGGPGRICGDHTVLMPGALTATCPDHRPSCRCGDPASFWCAGARCRSREAWCARHATAHPQDPGTAYCPDCFKLAFPRCEEPGCSAVGMVSCDWQGPDGRPCGHQACTRHAKRWQVFGPEEVGLGLCRAHGGVQGRPAEELVHQICAGAVRRRRVRMPTLRAFGHTLRNCGHRELAVDYVRIRALLASVGSRADGGRAQDLRKGLLDRAGTDWDRELRVLLETVVAGERLVERLRQLMVAKDPVNGRQMALDIRLEEYKPAFEGKNQARPARLWLLVPDKHRGRFIGKGGVHLKSYAGQLGVDIMLAGGKSDDHEGRR